MFMVPKNDIRAVLDKMILSASGWRGIFAENGDEESTKDQITDAYRIISGAAAYVFAEYLKDSKSCNNPLIFLGADTRPTGKVIIEAMIPVLISFGCEARYAGVVAAPEIMAWVRKKNLCREPARAAGFIYISASHNPIGHNGIKFGLTDGGVLASDEAVKLIARFHAFLDNDDCVTKIEKLFAAADPHAVSQVYACVDSVKSEAFKAYYDFCGEVVWGGRQALSAAMKSGLAENPLGIVCDFNGSARTVSIDRDFLSSLGFKFESINSEPGQIAHRIVPEGESLEPCCYLLEEVRKRYVQTEAGSTSFVLGYTPDCDGDRGNLVIWDDAAGKARALEAQEVFALACVAELSHLVWTGELPVTGSGEKVKAALAVNDPTSMRIDRIAGAFGVSVFRAEVGEANVVSLARNLREEGYIVRILGEGSAGGNITHPSAVRDPINTVIAIAKMLTVRFSNNALSENKTGGLFKIWRELSGQSEKYKDDFSLADIIASLPPFVTTPAYNKDAVMRIKTQDHAALKDRYQQIFLKEWEKQKNELSRRFGFCRWEAIAYNGVTETRNLRQFGKAGKGGLKILFFDKNGRETAYMWMRGSATEPVFRIMADAEGNDQCVERFLLDWQRCMIMEADCI